MPSVDVVYIDHANDATVAACLVDASTDTSTILVPVYASNPGLTPAAPRSICHEVHLKPDGSAAALPGPAGFDALSPASGASNGPIAPNSTGTSTIVVNYTEAAVTPPLGLRSWRLTTLPALRRADSFH